MSRHVIVYEGVKTVVGWDPPLQTFFIQHGPITLGGDWIGEGPAVWVGTAPRELIKLGQVAYLNDEHHLGISDHIMRQLENDQKYDV